MCDTDKDEIAILRMPKAISKSFGEFAHMAAVSEDMNAGMNISHLFRTVAKSGLVEIDSDSLPHYRMGEGDGNEPYERFAAALDELIEKLR